MSISRRQALSGATTVALAASLTACGGDEQTTASGGDPVEPSSSEPSATRSSPSPTKEGPPPPQPGGLVATSDVPVGGGVVIGEEEVVVTQPAKGEFRAYSALCTHQGCLLARVEAEEIQCDCHGSRFSIADGSPTNGPATAPLGAVEVTVAGGQVRRA